MSLKEILSRKSGLVTEVTTPEEIMKQAEPKVVCDNSFLKRRIAMWLNNEGWEYEDFAYFIELLGIKTPVKLSQWNEENRSFKCLTALYTEVSISICYGSWMENSSEIHITEGEETRKYTINPKCENDVPSVTLSGRTIKKNGKELTSYYSKYLCYRTLMLDATHSLKIEIDEPSKPEEESEIFVLRNCTDFENYLLGLDNSPVVSEVYRTTMQYLGFSDEDISNSEKILISYIETVDKSEHVLSKIFFKNGKMQEYAILEDGETFHVFRDGSWKYSSGGGIRIFYLEKKKHHVFSITGTEDSITNANPNEIVSRVKKKISELWKFVK